MWGKKINQFTFFLLILVVGLILNKSNTGIGQTFGASANISSALSVSVDGSRNYRGRETRIFNDNIDFGDVSFINPDLITNGDAFLQESFLILEATLIMEIKGNGYTSGEVLANRRISTTETFYKVQSSTSDIGTDNSIDIAFEPTLTQLKDFDSRTTQLPIRFLYYIDRSQAGRLVDNINLVASAR